MTTPSIEETEHLAEIDRLRAENTAEVERRRAAEAKVEEAKKSARCLGCYEIDMQLAVVEKERDWHKKALQDLLEVTGPLEKERDGLRAAVGAFLEVQGPCHEAEDDPPAMCDHPTCTYCNMQRALRQPEGEETT